MAGEPGAQLPGCPPSPLCGPISGALLCPVIWVVYSPPSLSPWGLSLRVLPTCLPVPVWALSPACPQRCQAEGLTAILQLRGSQDTWASLPDQPRLLLLWFTPHGYTHGNRHSTHTREHTHTTWVHTWEQTHTHPTREHTHSHHVGTHMGTDTYPPNGNTHTHTTLVHTWEQTPPTPHMGTHTLTPHAHM